MTEILVVYDGRCRLCRAAVALLALWDTQRKCAFLPFGTTTADIALSAIAPHERASMLRVVDDMNIYSGGAAARRILDVIPGGPVLSRLGLHRLYPPVARHRRLLGRFVPSVPPRARAVK